MYIIHLVKRLMESNPKAVKENMMQQCAQILACYRKNCASPSSAGNTRQVASPSAVTRFEARSDIIR